MSETKKAPTKDSPRHLVYGLLDPRNGELRYVGKSSSGMKRPFDHAKPYGRKGPTYRAKWLRELYLHTGQTPCVVVLKECSSDTDSLVQEIILIAMMKMCGYDLTNLTDGGDGFSGYIPTPETLEKQRLSRVGRKMGSPSQATREKQRRAMLGRKHTPEQNEKARTAKLGTRESPETKEKKRIAMLGHKHSPEHNEKIRQWNLGRKRSPEACAKMREVQQMPETREKIRQAHLGKKMSPEACEKNRLARLGKKPTEEARRNMSLAQKARYVNK